MDNNIKSKRMDLEEDLLDVYMEEMDALLSRYPEDPNQSELTEEKLNELMSDIDQSWEAFHSRWKHKMPKYMKMATSGRVIKKADGLRHLVIKSDVNEKELLDLSVPDLERDSSQIK